MKNRIVICSTIILFTTACNAQDYGETSRAIELTCGKTEVTISCGYNTTKDGNDNRICNKNKLSFIPSNLEKITPDISGELEKEASPESLYCAVGKDRQNYIIVTYSTGSLDCPKCHVDKAFTDQGALVGAGLPWQKVWVEHELPVGFTGLSIEKR